MEFITHVNIPDYGFKLSAKDKVLFMGSCFAENIGSLYPQLNDNLAINPFGIAFNPASILNHLHGDVPKELFLKKDFKVVHYFFHSAINAKSITDFNVALDTYYSDFSRYVSSISTVFISLGTANCYVHKQSGNIVCNNHKSPSDLFEKTLLSNTYCEEVLMQIVNYFKQINAKINVVFTVSPVKHLRDGIIENNRSKAVLLSAIHNCIEQSNAYYFPSYEIVNDELRDYRFYKSDMAHPSEQAQAYIYEKFKSVFFDESLMLKNTDFEKLQKLSNHKILSDDADAIQEHKYKVATEGVKFRNKWPD